MIIEIRAKNCYAFQEEIAFSMKADLRNKKFASNVHRENNFNVLKVAGIYGSNNSGKTCLVKCISAIKDVLLNNQLSILPNLFTDNSICELGVTFLHEGNKYAYDFKYNIVNKNYIYERFVQYHKDKYANEREEEWLLKDSINNEYHCVDKHIQTVMQLLSGQSLIIYLLEEDRFEIIGKIKQIVNSFASKIDILNMNNIPMEKTIELLKKGGKTQKKIARFIKNADLYLDDYMYKAEDSLNTNFDLSIKSADEKVLNIPETLMDQLRLTSIYKGISVPSLLYDSTGTKKLAALASYIVEALEGGRILVVDELDSSIHFKLTRAIVAMFNNELNKSAQLICTVHDINLMDCKRMLRKEQIWFVHKDDEGVYVYSLADYTAAKGVRDTTDVMEKYRKGVLGAVPDPDLINTLLDINGNNNEEGMDEQ